MSNAVNKSSSRREEALTPFVLLNAATTADAKLAPANRQFIPFGSQRDQQHLLELRATADAVMSGARTVDATSVTLGPGPEKYRRQRLKNGLSEYNLRVIVSGSGSINPNSEIFKHRFSPIILLTTARAPKGRLKKLQPLADEIKICGEDQIDFPEALRWLREKWNVKRLLCEGGGEVNSALFRAGLVDEVHMTLCPAIFGGRNAPTLSDGEGIQNLTEVARLELRSFKRVKDEVFVVYGRKG